MRLCRVGWLMMAGLCAGCPSSGSGYPSSCQDNEYLISQGDTWRCAPLPDPALETPQCAVGQVLGVSLAGRLTCLGDPLAALDTAIIAARIAGLEDLAARAERSSSGRFVGVTTSHSTGLITHPGTAPGLVAAAARCADEFAGAHLCSLLEMYDSVADGALGADRTVPKSWVVFSGWNPPNPGAVRPLDGLADNCAGYTYGADDLGWAGQAIEWTTLSTGAPGFLLHGGSEAPCSTQLPLACCLAARP